MPTNDKTSRVSPWPWAWIGNALRSASGAIVLGLNRFTIPSHADARLIAAAPEMLELVRAWARNDAWSAESRRAFRDAAVALLKRIDGDQP